MEQGYAFSVTFSEHDTQISRIREDNITINIDTYSSQNTESFKIRLREMLMDLLSRIQTPEENKITERCLSHDEYNSSIIRRKGTHAEAKKLGHTQDEVNTCAICLEELKYNRVWHSLGCNHLFHPKCLKQYLTQKCYTPCCPTCREPVNLK